MDIATFLKSNLPRTLFLCLLCPVIVASGFQTALEINKYWAVRRTVPFSFYGDAFDGLRNVLAKEKYLGYYTDKNIQDPKYSAQFEQAQFALAPIILYRVDISLPYPQDPPETTPQHRFILFDCQDEKACWRKIAEIKARPLKRNNLGAILALKMQN